MCASVIKVLSKMELKCFLFKLLLFQMLVAWCGARHVSLDTLLRITPLEDNEDVKNTIDDIIHSGIYSHHRLDPGKVQVVTPVKVTRDGELVSHVIEHDHEHGHARARRDLHDREHTLDHTLHYNLTVDGRELRLDLRPSVSFITPALVIERHTSSGRTRERPQTKSTSCHYTGSVRGQPASSIALSACDGLAGLLQTEHGEYWIEPSNQIPTDTKTGRPHVIFKRSAVDKVEAWHRAKRVADTNIQNTRSRQKYPTEQKRTRESIERSNLRRGKVMDPRRRAILEARRKRLEALRNNPVAYRRELWKQQNEEKRQLALQKSRGRPSNNTKGIHRTTSSNIKIKGKSVTNNGRPRRLKPRRRRRRRDKNCATKQPEYPWSNITNINKQQIPQRKEKVPNSPRHQLYQRPEHSRRSPRSISRPRYVEVLLVADRSMTEFHEKDNLETYLLTIMNMVSSLYMNPSIGNYIKVGVVKIILVEELRGSTDLNVSTDADATLNSFCKWQQDLNPDDDANPHHHDVAILITRTDICTQHDTPCSTLGVAHVAGMCKPDRSCSVNEDNGITLAHTITHELGHNFGLYHDTVKIGCHRREGSTLHIMTPVFEVDTAQVAWSNCSRRDLTNFLDAGLGECLADSPSQEEYVYPEVPAGVTFDAETQCNLQFGEKAQVCTDPAELCKHLWCSINGTCKSMLRPAAPGTTCGDGMWCQDLKCVPRTPVPRPVHGGWGDWSEWSKCSRTCGAGVSTQSRECNSPEPMNNGRYCIGERSRYKVCNTDPCPINEPSFREVQCSRYDNMTQNNETITGWLPYLDPDKPCELICLSEDQKEKEVEMIGGFVADGTPCVQTEGARDMCIAGVCHKVGCDWIVDSDVEEDGCGVCGGDGSACKTVQGIYSKGTTKQSGFSEVAVIPAGSRNVRIQEKVSPGNYISIGSAKSRKVYLKGARNQTLTEYLVAGAQAIYERDRDWEKVKIPGPIAEDIRVYQRIFRGRHRNPGVTYQYTVDRQRPPRRKFRYRMSEWTPCSVTCGIGYTRRHLQCVDEWERLVEVSKCYHVEAPRDQALMTQCRQPACAVTEHPPHWWWVGAWSPCSKNCRRPGDQPVKQRSVYCVDKKSNRVVEDSQCDQTTKPNNKIRCADVPPC